MGDAFLMEALQRKIRYAEEVDNPVLFAHFLDASVTEEINYKTADKSTNAKRLLTKDIAPEKIAPEKIDSETMDVKKIDAKKISPNHIDDKAQQRQILLNQFQLLLDTMADESLPVHWRNQCLNHINKPLLGLQRLADCKQSTQQVNSLFYELRVMSYYLQPGLSS